MKTEVEVITSDLERWKQAINTAYYKSLTEDMQKAYTNLSDAPRNSALTNLLEQSLTKVDSYLELAKEEEKPEDEDDV